MTATIISTGVSIPATRYSAQELAQRRGIAAARVLRTGHRMIAIATGTDTPSTLAAAAARAALERADLDAQAIDTLIYCGSHKDYAKWQASTAVQQAIGNDCANCFDLYQGCNSPLLALSLAKAAIAAGSARKVLIVAAECWGSCTEDHMLSDTIYVGDGAAAMIVGADGAGVRPRHFGFRSNGRFNDLWYIKGGAHVAGSGGEVAADDHLYKVRRALGEAELAEFTGLAARLARDMFADCLRASALSAPQLDYILMLNANDRHNQHYLETIDCLDKPNSRELMGAVGHLGGADFIYNLHRCMSEGKVDKGSTILAYSGGAGYSWSTALLEVV